MNCLYYLKIAKNVKLTSGAIADESIGRRSSGNVFADLRLPDSPELLAKAELVGRICDIIEKRGLTQVQAAEILEVDQPKVSALMRGDLRGFSSDRLFRFLTALGRDIDIVIKPKPRARAEARIRVVQRAARRKAG